MSLNCHIYAVLDVTTLTLCSAALVEVKHFLHGEKCSFEEVSHKRNVYIL